MTLAAQVQEAQQAARRAYEVARNLLRLCRNEDLRVDANEALLARVKEAYPWIEERP